MTAVRLVAYAPNGARQGPIPAPQQVSTSYVLNDTGALTLNYALEGPNSALLGQPVELVTEVSTDGGVTWTEPENGRFLYLQDGRDPIKAEAYQISCPSYVRRLAKALVPFTGLNSEGNRAFTAAKPGQILNVLLSEAQARGALASFAWDFTAANDSAGVAWPAATAQTIAYSPGTDFLAILQGMADAGLVDYRMQGRTLQVYAADTVMADDKSDDANRVALRWGRDLTEAPFRRTWEGLADTAFVLGDNLATLVRTNGAAITPWGRQETYVTASGVTDAGTLQIIADGSLEATQDARIERTYGLDFTTAKYLPFRDYGIGAWVFGATDGNAPERMRVRQITLTMSDQGVAAGNVVLNDRFLESDILQARKLTSLLAGATQATPGAPSSPVGNDILAPAQTTGLTASSTAYQGPDGYPRAQITLDWADVTTNADGSTATDVDHYEVHRRRQGDTTWTLYRETNLSFMTDSPYQINETWEFKVRAVDAVYNRGAFSSVATVATATDTTPPTQPSQPTAVSTLRGTLQITWDGLTNTGGAMPSDLAYVEVHVKDVNGFTPVPGLIATMVARLRPGGGQVALTGLPVTSTQYVRLVAVDTSLNPSTPSVQRSVVVAKGTDGLAPTIPGGWAPTLKQLGVMALQAQWTPIVNPDPVTYDVYCTDGGPVSVFDATTLIGSTSGASLPITTLPGSALIAGHSYYLAVKVRDEDGTAAGSGTAGPTAPRQADSAAISASWVYAGNVETVQLKSGSLVSDVGVLGSLSIGALKFDPLLGMTITMLDGSTTYIRADGSGNRFSGQATLDECLIQGDLSIEGTTNTLKGTLRLGSGVTDPTSTPTVGQDVPSRVVTTNGRGYKRRGLVATATSWVTCEDLQTGDSQVESWARTGNAAPTGEVSISVADLHAGGGVTKFGTKWWVLGTHRTTGEWWFTSYNADGSGKGNVVQPAAIGSTQRQAIGSDGSNIYVFRLNPSNQGFVEKYNGTTGAIISTVNLAGTWDAEPSGVYIGNAGGLLGATRYVLATVAGGTRVYDTSGNRVSSEEWLDATSYACLGLTFDSGVFHRFQGEIVHSYTTEPGGSREFGVAWYKLDTSVTPNVSYETRVGTTVAKTVRRFWRTTLTVPRAPMDPTVPLSPDTTRVYAGTVGGTLYRQGSLPNSGTDTVMLNALLTVTAEKLTSDYDLLAGAIARLYSTGNNAATLPTFEFKGDGSGRMADLAWDASGVRTNGAKGAVQYSRSTLRTVSTAAWNSLTVDTTVWEDTQLYSRPGGFPTFTKGGLYHLTARCIWATTSATGRRLLRLYVSTSNAVQTGTMVALAEEGGSTVVSPTCHIAEYFMANAGDILVPQVWQNSGGNLDVVAGSFVMTLRKVG